MDAADLESWMKRWGAFALKASTWPPRKIEKVLRTHGGSSPGLRSDDDDGDHQRQPTYHASGAPLPWPLLWSIRCGIGGLKWWEAGRPTEGGRIIARCGDTITATYKPCRGRQELRPRVSPALSASIRWLRWLPPRHQGGDTSGPRGEGNPLAPAPVDTSGRPQAPKT